MKRFIYPITTAALFLALTSCGQPSGFEGETMTEEEFVKQEGTGVAPADLADFTEMKVSDISKSEKARILSDYEHLDPQHIVPTKLLEDAVVYFEANKSKFPNKNYISVIDFSKKSTKARFFIINLASGSVWAIHTAHGKGSDGNNDGIAESFGNVSGSGKSSLGFYRTAETYNGKNGNSLRLDGLSSTNSKARSRAVVLHGANYVSEQPVIQGRSLGCPAVTHPYRDNVIGKLKNGSLIFAGLSGIR